MTSRRGSSETVDRDNSESADTDRQNSASKVLGRKKETYGIIIYLRSFVYLCYAFLIFIVVWMMGRGSQKFSIPPTIITPRHTIRNEFSLGMIQSPSLFCSEFGRHLMLNYRNEMGVEEVAAGIQLCLRYAHPHQTSGDAYESTLALFQSQDLCRFRENQMLRTAPREATAWGGNWDALVATGPTANAITQDGLTHWFWKWTTKPNEGKKWERTEFGMMLKEALEWWTHQHRAIPVSPSLQKAMSVRSSYIRHSRDADFLIDSRRRHVQGDLFTFPSDIYPKKPINNNPTLLMRYRTSNISRMGFPDRRGVRRDYKICKYSALSESTADLMQIFMTTFGDQFNFVGEHNFSPEYMKGMLKMEESMLAKWMNWNYLDPERFREVLANDLNITNDPFMTDSANKNEHNLNRKAKTGLGKILAERGSETTNSWRGLDGAGTGYGMWYNCTDLFDETIFPYDLNIYPILGKVPVQRWYDAGTALISVVNHNGDSAIAISSLYDEFGSGSFYNNQSMNGFQKLLKQEFTRQAVKEQFHPFILPFQPLIVAVDRADVLFPYNMEVYGTVASGRNLVPLVEPIEILLAAAFGPWAVMDIDRALSEGRMHMSWVTDDEYQSMADDTQVMQDGLSRGIVKLQYPDNIPATIREIVIKKVESDGPKVLRESFNFDDDDKAIGFSWSSATGIVGSNRAGIEEYMPQATGY